jgi:hypothetical protein
VVLGGLEESEEVLTNNLPTSNLNSITNREEEWDNREEECMVAEEGTTTTEETTEEV